MRLSIRKAYSYVFASFGSLLFGSSATAFYAFHSKGDQNCQHDDIEVSVRTMSKTSGSKESSPARSNVACSFEKSVLAADSTLKQLSTAKETFSDFEAFYKKFVVELNSVKAEHRVELEKFDAQITELTKNKEKLLSQLQNSKEENNKHRDELLSYKKKFAELEWENEKLNYEITTNKTNNDKLRRDKEVLQQENESLRKKLADNKNAALKFSSKEGESDKLDIVKHEAEELEKRYRQALEDKEALHEDIVALQKRVSELREEYNKNQDELQTQAQNANVRAYKAEMQLQNITRQKESLKKQLDESEDEIKSHKDKCASLEKDIAELKHSLSLNNDDAALKMRQLDAVKELNKTLESKLETMNLEIVTEEVSVATFTSPEQSFDEQLLLSRIKEIETSLRSSNTAKDKLEGEVLFAHNTIADLKDSNTKLQENIKDLHNKLSASREQASALESELFTNINKLTSFEHESHDHQLEVQELSTSLETTKQRCVDLETSYEQALAEKEEFKLKANFAERKVAEMKEIVKQDEDINCELEDKLANMKNQVFKMEGQKKSNLKQIETLRAELEAEKTSKGNSKQEFITLQNKLNETERNYERHQRESKINTSMNDELKKSLALKEKKVNTLNEEVSKLQARIEVLEEEDKNLHEENLDAKNKLKELQKEHDVLVQEKSRLNDEIQGAYKSVNELQSESNVNEHSKQELDHQLLLLQEKLKKSDAELEETLKQNALLDAKSQEAVISMSRKTEEVERLRNELKESQTLLDCKEQELHKKELTLEELRLKTMTQSTYVESIHDEHENTKLLLETTQKEKLAMIHQLERETAENNRVKVLNDNLSRQKNHLENERDKLAAKLKVAESSIRNNSELSLRKTLEVEQTRTAKMEKKLEMYKSKFEMLQSRTDSSIKDVMVFTEDLEYANEKISDLTLDLEKSLDEKIQETAKIHLLESKISDLEKDLSIECKLKEDKEVALDEASMKILKLESTTEALNKQRNDIKEKLNAANDKNLSQLEEIMRLQSKINEHKKSNDALNHVINKNDHVINEQREKIHSYDAEVIKLRQELRTLQVISEGLKTEKSGYEKRCSAYQQKIQSVEADVFKARENKLLLEQELSVQNLKLNTAENQLSNLKSEKDRCTKELENAQSTTREAKQELLRNQNKLRETQRSLENASEDLKEKESVIAKIRDDKNSLEAENLSLKADIETLRRNIKEGEIRVEDLERTLETSISETLEASLTSQFEQEESDLEMKVFQAEQQAMEREKTSKQKLKELRKKLSTKELELRSTQQKYHESFEEAKALQIKYERMETIHEKLEIEKKELKEQLTNAKIAISDLEVRYDFEIIQRDTVESQLNDSLKKMNDVRTEVHKLEQDNANKLLTTELVDKESKGRDIELERLKKSKRILEDQNEELSLLFKEKSVENNKKRSEMVLLQEELLALRSFAYEKESQLKRCQFEHKCAQEDCQAYLLRISTMEQNIADLNNENCHLNVTVQCLKDASEKCDLENTYSEERAVEIQQKADKLVLEVSRNEQTTQDLKHHIRLLENELDISKQTAKKLEDNCASLLKQKNDIGQEVKILKDKERTAVSKNTIEKALIEKDVASKSRILELEHDYEHLQEKQNELLDELAVSNAELSKWRNLYNTTSSKTKELEEEISSFQEEHKDASSKLEEINLEMQKMISKNGFLEEELATARRSKMQLETQLNEKEHELYILTNQEQIPIPNESSIYTERFDPWPEKVKMEEDVQRLRQEVKDLQHILYVTSKDRDEAERHIFIVKAKENDASLKIKHSEEHIKQLTNELKSHRQKLLSTEMELQKAISEQSKTRGHKQATDNQLSLTFEENTTLHKELSSLKSLCHTHKKELAGKSNELDMCTRKMESYAKDCATLKAQLKSIKEEYEKLQNEVNKMQREVKEKNERITFLESALKNAQQPVSLPDKEIRSKSMAHMEHEATDNADVPSLLSKVSTLNAQKEILEENLRERDDEIRNLQKEIYDLRLKIHSLQQEKSRFERICLDKSTSVHEWTGENKVVLDNNTSESLRNEMNNLKRENDQLKVELSRLEAQKAFVEIQESSYKHLDASKTHTYGSKKDRNTRATGPDEEEDQEDIGIEIVGKQYSVVISEIMELSRQLQNYKLDISEWNGHYNEIIVSSERLQSTYHALQALLDDLNASYEEHKNNIETALGIQGCDHVDGKNQYSSNADQNSLEESAIDNKKNVGRVNADNSYDGMKQNANGKRKETNKEPTISSSTKLSDLDSIPPLQDNKDDPNSKENGSSALEYSLRQKIAELESKLETTARKRDNLMRQEQGELPNSELESASNETLNKGTDDAIKDLQRENHELKLQVEILKKTDGNSNALIAQLRVMVARLHKELEACKIDSFPGLKNRYSYEKPDRFSDMNNNPKIATSSLRRNKYKPKTENTSKVDQEFKNPSEMNSSNFTPEKGSTSGRNESEKMGNDMNSLKEEMIVKEDSPLQSSCRPTSANNESSMSQGLFTDSPSTQENGLNECTDNNEREEPFTPKGTSSPTTLLENSTSDNNNTNESKDSSDELVGLSSPDKSWSFNSERTGSASGRASASSTSPSGRSTWPYTSTYNSYRSTVGYSSSYSKKPCVLTRRNSFTKKYC